MFALVPPSCRPRRFISPVFTPRFPFHLSARNWMSRTAVFVKLMRYSRPPRMSAYHDREHEQTRRSGCQGESQGRCHPRGHQGSGPAVLIAEEIAFLYTTLDPHVIFQNGNHEAVQRNDPYLANLSVPQNDLPSPQIYITPLDVARSSSTATAIQKEIHDHPCPILTETTVLPPGFFKRRANSSSV